MEKNVQCSDQWINQIKTKGECKYMKNFDLDYFYGSEAEQFSFYRLPKILFTDDRFSDVSAEAKILYGLLLDRMSLSIKNGWVDEENRAYIYFRLDDAMEMLKIGKDKGVKLFAELDAEKGCGLITRKKQGLGKPAIIYVMNFATLPQQEVQSVYDDADDIDNVYENDDVCEFQTSDIPKSCVWITVIAKNRRRGVFKYCIPLVFRLRFTGGNTAYMQKGV